MYNARIETDAGEVVRLGYRSGIIFDIDPLSGVNVNLGTSQGFQQIGETVESQSVAGVSRTISGVITGGESVARAMLRALPIFTSGRLYYDDKYYCEIIVSKTPYITRSNGRIAFSMMVFCSTPYWLDVSGNAYIIGGYTPAFSFPVVYDSHIFGVRDASAFVNCYNGGAVDVPFEVEFTCTTPVTNFGITNVHTLEHLTLNTTLQPGDAITVKRTSGRLYVERVSGDVKEDVFSVLDDSSDLFWVHPGDNVLRTTADSGLDSLSVSVAYHAAEIGVL